MLDGRHRDRIACLHAANAARRPYDVRVFDVRLISGEMPISHRDVNRFGEYASRWFLVAGAAAALVMAMAKVDYFWIANVIYLGFVLWAVAGSALKLVAYRRGL